MSDPARGIELDSLQLQQAAMFALEQSKMTPAPVHGNMFDVVRSTYVKADLNRFIQYMEPIIRGFQMLETNFMTSVVLPYEYTNTLTVRSTMVQFLPIIPTATPAFGTGREPQRVTTMVETQSKRYMLNIKLDKDFEKLKEGFQDFLTQIQFITITFKRYAAYLGMSAILECGIQVDSFALRQMTRELDENLTISTRDHFALIHRSRLGLAKVAHKVRESIRRKTNGVNPSVLYFPSHKMIVVLANEQNVSYDKAGPNGPKMLMNVNGAELLPKIQGMELHEAPELPDPACSYTLLTHLVRIGHYALCELKPDQDVSKVYGWSLFDQFSGKMQLISCEEIMHHVPFMEDIQQHPTKQQGIFEYILLQCLYKLMQDGTFQSDPQIMQPVLHILSESNFDRLDENDMQDIVDLFGASPQSKQQAVDRTFSQLCTVVDLDLNQIPNWARVLMIRMYGNRALEAYGELINIRRGIYANDTKQSTLKPRYFVNYPAYKQYLDDLPNTSLSTMETPYMTKQQQFKMIGLTSEEDLQRFVSFLLVQPLQTLMMDRMVGVVPGTTLGKTLLTNPEIMLGSDATNASSNASYRQFVGIHLLDGQRNVEVADHAMYEATIGGANTRLISLDEAKRYMSNGFEIVNQTDPSLYAIPIGKNTLRDGPYLELLGRSRYDDARVLEQYQGSEFWSNVYGFNMTNLPEHGGQLEVRDRSVATKLFSMRVDYLGCQGGTITQLGAGYHGPYGEGPGCAQIRAKGEGLFPILES